MKNILLTFFLAMSLNGICQLTGVVIDKESDKPVSYANIWIENEDIGTTSDINGNFGLKDAHLNKNLVVSAVGYESQTVLIDASSLEIILVPRVYEISEVMVKPNKKSRELVISIYKKSKIIDYTGTLSPEILARYFPYKNEYQSTPFIKSIKLETYSKSASSFRLRFLTINEEGQPDMDIINDNLIIKVKKGRRSLKIDGFGNEIAIPKEGIFIAIEFLIIKENEYLFWDKHPLTVEREIFTAYMPMIGTQNLEDNENAWIYDKGKWWNNQFAYNVKSKKEVTFYIAMEVVLSN